MNSPRLIYLSWGTDTQGKSAWIETLTPTYPGEKITVKDSDNEDDIETTPIVQESQSFDEKA